MLSFYSKKSLSSKQKNEKTAARTHANISACEYARKMRLQAEAKMWQKWREKKDQPHNFSVESSPKPIRF